MAKLSSHLGWPAWLGENAWRRKIVQLYFEKKSLLSNSVAPALASEDGEIGKLAHDSKLLLLPPNACAYLHLHLLLLHPLLLHLMLLHVEQRSKGQHWNQLVERVVHA